MTTRELLMLLLSWLVGGVVGTLFFGGLWWTISRLASTRRPARWVLGSLVVRTSIVLSGFWLVADEHLERVLGCLLGFLCARFLVTRLVAHGTTQPLSHAHMARMAILRRAADEGHDAA